MGWAVRPVRRSVRPCLAAVAVAAKRACMHVRHGPQTMGPKKVVPNGGFRRRSLGIYKEGDDDYSERLQRVKAWPVAVTRGPNVGGVATHVASQASGIVPRT